MSDIATIKTFIPFSKQTNCNLYNYNFAVKFSLGLGFSSIYHKTYKPQILMIKQPIYVRATAYFYSRPVAYKQLKNTEIIMVKVNWFLNCI